MRALALALLLLPGLPAAGFAQDVWPQWRGPTHDSVAPTADLPTHWSKTENVIWKTALPPGHSSPILVGPRIFLTAYQGDTLLTISLDRATGKILWRREAPRPRKQHLHVSNNPASPSPVSDGKNVYITGYSGLYGFAPR